MHPIQEDYLTMHYAKDHRTGYLFNPWVQLGPRRRQILDTGWPGLFRKNLLNLLPVDCLAKKFKEFRGRHTKELFTMLGGLILQQMFDLSDEEAREALLFRTDWQYALDITDSSDESLYVSERTWRSYRQFCITEELDRKMFEMFTDALIKMFGVDTTKQRLDSTHMLSNMRKMGRIRIFVATIQKFLRVLKRRHPNLFAALDKGFIERYLAKDADACFSRVKPSESSRTLQEVAEDLASLVEQFAGYEDVQKLPEFHLLERVLREQCEVASSNAKVTVKPPREVSSDSLQNPSDPDAGYDAHKGSGYQAQLMETYQPQERKDPKIPNLITYVEVEPAHIHDTYALQPAIDDTAQRDCCPDELLCDTLYGSEDNVQKAQEKGVTVIAPMPGNTPKKGFSLADFTCDPATQYVTHCPEGHYPQKTYRTKKNRLCANFPRETCLTCSRRTDCPVQFGKKAVYLHYDDEMLRHAQRRAHEDTPEFKSKYRWRSGIEGTNSHIKHDIGASRFRVRGLPAMKFAGTLKALGLNIMRSACAMKARIAEGLSPLMGQNSLVTVIFSLLRSLFFDLLFKIKRKCHPLYKYTCFYLCP
jgi:hypothetical protein